MGTYVYVHQGRLDGLTKPIKNLRVLSDTSSMGSVFEAWSNTYVGT